MRRATWSCIDSEIHPLISIHALLAESDAIGKGNPFPCNISIHALLAESDRRGHGLDSGKASFQSTLSLRRATCWHSAFVLCDRFQSTLSLRRATHAGGGRLMTRQISIHALLAESDFSPCSLLPTERPFQSTLSLRRATHMQVLMWSARWNFNPRSPCGERLCSRCHKKPRLISIHALLAESDRCQGVLLPR